MRVQREVDLNKSEMVMQESGQRSVRKYRWMAGSIVALLLSAFSIGIAQTAGPRRAPLPTIVKQGSHYALMVDGAPYLMLGMQANNSSAWPGYLDKVWPAAEDLHANTVELPIYWEQFEPEPSRYDYSVLDTILTQARAHHFRLVLLWFGTWKNGASHYNPEWMKLDQKKYPFVLGIDGKTVDSPSVYSTARLEADKNAFRALMLHLKSADAQHTVLMVQVENETGVWGSARDYRPEADKDFAGQVPGKLVTAMGKKAGTWREVFGEDADELFQGWAIASYVEQVAAAGKAVNPLPMYVNAWLRDPFHPTKPPVGYESGGPTDNAIPLWKAAAPSIDVIAPDIYIPEYAKYIRVLDLYQRPDNPLLIPETNSGDEFARYVFASVGRGAIGWSPFGLDWAENQIDVSESMNRHPHKPFAMQYALLSPISRLLARANFEGRVHGSSEDPNHHYEKLNFDQWQAVVAYGKPGWGELGQSKGNPKLDGGVVLVQLGENEFLVAGHHANIDFASKESGKKRLFLKVEEGIYDADGKWQMIRLWNGDQTDTGLNLSAEGKSLLRVKLTTF